MIQLEQLDSWDNHEQDSWDNWAAGHWCNWTAWTDWIADIWTVVNCITGYCPAILSQQVSQELINWEVTTRE